VNQPFTVNFSWVEMSIARAPTETWAAEGDDYARGMEGPRRPRETIVKERSPQDQYQGLVHEGIAQGRVQVLDGGLEKRQHPRFAMRATQVWSAVERSYPVVDKSLTGVAFLTAQAFPVGEMVKISMRRFFAVDAVVVGCEIVETDPTYLEYLYKVRCRFRGLDPALLHVLVAMDMDSDAKLTVSA
jgi:hypothetical protein